jgi:hypothetical protein
LYEQSLYLDRRIRQHQRIPFPKAKLYEADQMPVTFGQHKVRISADRDQPFRHRDRRFGIVTDRSGIVTGGALQG